MGDRIRLTGIEVVGRHGVYTGEKFSDQPFVVDLDCVIDRRLLVRRCSGAEAFGAEKPGMAVGRAFERREIDRAPVGRAAHQLPDAVPHEKGDAEKNQENQQRPAHHRHQVQAPWRDI